MAVGGGFVERGKENRRPDSLKRRAGPQRAAGQKLSGREPLAAFALQFQNAQRPLAAAHDDARLSAVTTTPGRAGLVHHFGFPDFQQVRLGLAG